MLCQVISLRPIILSNTHQARSKELEEGRESMLTNFACQHKEQQIKIRIYYANLLVSKVHYNFVHITVIICILYMIVNDASYWKQHRRHIIIIMRTQLQLRASDTSKPPNGLHTSKTNNYNDMDITAIISHM